MSSYFDPQPDRTQVWSCGGGVQSVAIAALICKDYLPKPDISIIVNTEREKTGTFIYWGNVVCDELHKKGIELTIIDKSQYALNDLYSNDGTLLIPAFTTMSGKVSKFSTFCSGRWKKEVIFRYLAAKKVKQSDNWLGYSIDEIRRVKDDRTQNRRHIFPLVEFGLSRTDCLQIIKEMGWPDPPRSACWMCPNQSDREWIYLRDYWPNDFKKACDFEIEMQQKDSHFWLHRQCIPLGQVVFSTKDQIHGSCESGQCFV